MELAVSKSRFKGRVDPWFHLITVSFLVICSFGVVLFLSIRMVMPPLVLFVVAIAVIWSFLVLLQQICKTLRNYTEFEPDGSLLIAYGLKTERIDEEEITSVVVKKSDINGLESPFIRVLAILASTFVYGQASLFKDASSLDRIWLTVGDRVVILSVKDEAGFLRMIRGSASSISAR